MTTLADLFHPLRIGLRCGGLAAFVTLVGCENSPYPAGRVNVPRLYVAYNHPPKTLDPARADDTVSQRVAGLVHATLLEYDYYARPYALRAGLARQVPQALLGADGKYRYTFELRPGLRYAP